MKTGSALKVKSIYLGENFDIEEVCYCVICLEMPFVEDLTMTPDETSLTLTWTPMPGVDSYMITVIDNTDSTEQTISDVPGDASSYIITDLIPGHSYTVVIQPVISGNMGAPASSTMCLSSCPGMFYIYPSGSRSEYQSQPLHKRV